MRGDWTSDFDQAADAILEARCGFQRLQALVFSGLIEFSADRTFDLPDHTSFFNAILRAVESGRPRLSQHGFALFRRIARVGEFMGQQNSGRQVTSHVRQAKVWGPFDAQVLRVAVVKASVGLVVFKEDRDAPGVHLRHTRQERWRLLQVAECFIQLAKQMRWKSGYINGAPFFVGSPRGHVLS